jgi:hypothetical protein
MSKGVTHAFSLLKILKNGDAFSFPLEYATRKVQGNHVGLKLDGKQQILVYIGVRNSEVEEY